jgi:hypothetical protein
MRVAECRDIASIPGVFAAGGEKISVELSVRFCREQAALAAL